MIPLSFHLRIMFSQIIISGLYHFTHLLNVNECVKYVPHSVVFLHCLSLILILSNAVIFAATVNRNQFLFQDDRVPVHKGR